jgi:hypothetical protein
MALYPKERDMHAILWTKLWIKIRNCGEVTEKSFGGELQRSGHLNLKDRLGAQTKGPYRHFCDSHFLESCTTLISCVHWAGQVNCKVKKVK